MSLVQSNGMALGTKAPAFSLPGVDGVVRDLESFEAKALVIVFTCNHCPYAIACEDRLVAFARDYAGRAQLVLINSNDGARYPADSLSAMRERAREKGFDFPYLHDESQEVARAYDAACTPDPFVFDENRKLVYNGRIDDSWQDEGAVTHRDLRAAVDRTLEGQPVDFDVAASMGCSIKWK